MTEQIIAKRYVTKTRLGSGLLGSSYLGHDLATGKSVVIKIISSPAIGDKTVFSNFYITFRAFLDLTHESLLKPLDSGLTTLQDSDELVPFIVLDHFKGVPLVTDASQSYAPEKALQIFRQLLSVVKYMHSMGFVHRGLKPGNMLINQEFAVKILHFGIYPFREQEDGSNYQNILSAAYRAPELNRGGDGDTRSDLYSLGITLFHMLTGSLPFTGGNCGEIIAQQDENPMETIKSSRLFPNKKTEHILKKLLEPDPELRYGSAEELEKDIEKLQGLLLQAKKTAKKTGTREYGFIHILRQIRKFLDEGVQALIVTGTPGYGREELLEYAVSEAGGRGYKIVSYISNEGYKAPYELMAKIIHHLLDGKKTTDYSNISWMIPVLIGERSFRSAESEDYFLSGGETRDIRAEIISCMEKLVTEKTLVAIDHMELLDDYSRQLIFDLCSTIKNLKIIACGDESCKTEAREIKTFPLKGLTEKETDKIIRQMTGAVKVPEDLLSAVCKQTGGNLTFIRELVEYIQSKNMLQMYGKKLVFDDSACLCLPESLEAILEEKYDRLSGEMKNLYSVAACSGYYFEKYELLKALEIVSETKLEQLLEEGLERGLHKNSGTSGYAFSNPLFQKICIKRIPPGDDRYIYRHLALAGESHYISNPMFHSERICLLFRLAGDEYNETVYDIKSAEKYTILGLYGEAAALYARIAEKIRYNEKLLREYWKCLYRLGLLHMKSRNYPAAEKYLLRAVEIAEEKSDSEAVQECFLHLTDIYIQEQNHEKARMAAKSGLAQQSLKESIWKSMLLARKGMLAARENYMSQSFDDAVNDLKKSFRIAQELRSFDNVIRSAELMAELYTQEHMASDAESLLTGVLNYRIRPDHRLEVMQRLTQLYLYPGSNMFKAREYGEKGLALAAEQENEEMLFRFSLLLARIYGNLGKKDLAAKTVRHMESRAKNSVSRQAELAMLVMETALKEEHIKKAENEYRILEKLVKDSGVNQSDFHFLKATLLLRQNKIAKSRVFYEKALLLAQREDYFKGVQQALIGLSYSYLKRRNPQKATEYLTKATVMKKRGISRYTNAVIFYMQAVIHREKKNYTLAAELLRMSQDIFARGGYRNEEEKIKTQIYRTRELSEEENAKKGRKKPANG